MATLHYITNVSLDGYIEDANGSFDWGEPSDELHTFYADLIRPVTTFLYGRRLYETMAVWETDPSLSARSAVYADFAAAWQDADKIVYTSTLDTVPTARTRIEANFDADMIRDHKATAGGEVTVGGAELAGYALRAGLVDEVHLVVHPVIVGGGKHGLPADFTATLELLDQRRFGGGVVYLRYRVTG